MTAAASADAAVVKGIARKAEENDQKDDGEKTYTALHSPLLHEDV